MVISHGDVVWVDWRQVARLGAGEDPARRSDGGYWLLASDVATVLVVPVTSNTALEAFPGNVLLPAASASMRTRSPPSRRSAR